MPSTVSSRNERPIVAVVEADPARRGLICALLGSLDITVSAYESAESYLESATPDACCLITDVALPGMSGIDLLRCLRERGSMLPMIVVGEDYDVRTAVTAIREGASDFIERPRLELAIVQRVEQLLRSTSGFAS
jgi:FixJ family two-component response regulator